MDLAAEIDVVSLEPSHLHLECGLFLLERSDPLVGAGEILACTSEVNERFAELRGDGAGRSVLDRGRHGQTQGNRDAMTPPAAAPRVLRAAAGGFVSLGRV
jgi:hypothetical protein